MPHGKYRGIVIDPILGNKKNNAVEGNNQQVDFNYLTMSTDEIKRFDVSAHDECRLYI